MTKTELAPPSLGYVWAPTFIRIGEDGRLECDWGKRVKRRPTRDLLGSFCGLAETNDIDRAVAGFAKRWGMLGLCEHGLPFGHSRQSCALPQWETVQAWRDFAVCLSALHRIGLSLNRRQSGDPVDWELADSILCGPDFRPWGSDMKVMTDGLEMARTTYMTLMRRLITVCSIQPRFQWSNGAWNIDLDSQGLSNLPAILASQLMFEVGGAKRAIKCSSCPQWFVPKRNQRKYCSKCGIKAAWREAAQRKRAGLTRQRRPGSMSD